MASAVARVAIRGARYRLVRVAMTLAGVAVSVAFVAAVHIATASMQRSFERSFADAFGSSDLVVRARYGPTNSFAAMLSGEQALVAESLVGDIARIDGVRKATGRVQAPITIIGNDGEPWRPGAAPHALGLNWEDDESPGRWVITSGHAPVDADDVVVDQYTADSLSLRPGDSLSIAGRSGIAHHVRVAGIGSFGSTGTYAGTSVVLARTPAAQAMFLEPGMLTWISVEGASGLDQGSLRQRVVAALPDDVKAVTGSRFARDAQALLSPLVHLVERFLLAFAYVALLVSSYAIYNTFSIVVAQRRKELALLRAVGASRRQLMLAVLGEAAVVGLVASGLGALLGVIVAAALRTVLVHFGVVLATAPLYVPMVPVLVAMASGFGVIMLAAIGPSWRASQARVVATLQTAAADDVGRPRARMVFSFGLLTYGVTSSIRGLAGEGPDRMAPVATGITACLLAVVVCGPLLWQPVLRSLHRPLVVIGGVTGGLAVRNAGRQPMRTARIASSVIVSVALMTMFAVMTSSMTAATAATFDRAIRADLVIRPDGGLGTAVSEEAREAIRRTAGVEVVTALRFGAAEANNVPATAVGIDPDTIARFFALRVVGGELESIGGEHVGVDAATARQHGWSPGSRITGEFVQTGYEELEVAAVIEADVPFGAPAKLYMPASDLDRRVSLQSRGDAIVFVKASAATDPSALRDELRRVLKDFPALDVVSREQFAASEAAVGEAFLDLVAGLLAIALGVALVGVGNTLLLTTLERTSELGVLRAVGMFRRQVGAMVRWEAGIVAFVSSAAGIAFGLVAGAVLTAGVATDGSVSPLVPWGRVVWMAVLCVAMAMLAATVPARRAARLDVLDAIGAP